MLDRLMQRMDYHREKRTRSPAETLNGFSYHSDWLQNLLISASLGGSGRAPKSVRMSKILSILKETQGIEPPDLAQRLDLKPSDLEREIAALRHMERIRAAMKEGKKVICLW